MLMPRRHEGDESVTRRGVQVGTPGQGPALDLYNHGNQDLGVSGHRGPDVSKRGGAENQTLVCCMDLGPAEVEPPCGSPGSGNPSRAPRNQVFLKAAL